jgi:hypothetical protein
VAEESGPKSGEAHPKKVTRTTKVAESSTRRNPKKARRAISGPFLTAALFCDQIVEDKDGSLSCIRIIDTVNITLDPTAPKDMPSETNRIPVVTRGLVAFRGDGGRRKRYNLRLVMESPSGKSGTVLEQEIQFSGEAHGGANFNFTCTIAVKKGGLFWLRVLLDEKDVTRVPLLITVKRSEAAATVDAKST